jgi:hypothetical protein
MVNLKTIHEIYIRVSKNPKPIALTTRIYPRPSILYEINPRA